MDTTTLTVGGVVALLGALLAWVASRTRRPVERPPEGPVVVPEAERARGRAKEMEGRAAALRDAAEAEHEAARAVADVAVAELADVDPDDAEAVAAAMRGES